MGALPPRGAAGRFLEVETQDGLDLAYRLGWSRTVGVTTGQSRDARDDPAVILPIEHDRVLGLHTLDSTPEAGPGQTRAQRRAGRRINPAGARLGILNLGTTGV